jgi:predicted DsbA family dithiol-disulfide isomerase
LANQGTLDLKDLPSPAEALGLALPAFHLCLASGRSAEAMRQDLVAGQQAGVTGTPACLCGVTGPHDAPVTALYGVAGGHQ